MSNVWFTSDLHLGHKYAAKARGFDSVEEHDFTLVENINKLVRGKDKLFILGDVAFTSQGFKMISMLPRTMELIIGNHDTQRTVDYLRHFVRVHGFRQYKEFWLSHCPIHPQELYRCRGNIHGHIHKGTATPPLDYPYFNVNVDFHNMMPVNFATILTWFDEHEC